MMKYSKHWKSLCIAAILVFLNLFFVVQVIGLSYTSFDWLRFAEAYAPVVKEIYLPIMLKGD